MVEIVDEEVELHLIDTRQLVEEAKKLKEAQRIKDEQKNVLKKDPAQLKEEKELLKRLEKGKKKPLTSSQAPTPFTGGKTDETILSSEAKKQTRKGAVTGQNTANAFTDAQKKIKEIERKQKKLQKDVAELPNKILGKIDEAKSLLNSSTTSAGMLGIFTGIASRFGPVGIIAATVAAIIIPSYFDAYERGGILSTKLPIREKEKNIADIDYVIDVRSGTKFITSDLTITQKAPETSNTLNLRYEHIRYTSQELGK